MPDYRRYLVPGGTYFFTLVTHERRLILTSDVARGCLRDAFRRVRSKRPFAIAEIVVLQAIERRDGKIDFRAAGSLRVERKARQPTHVAHIMCAKTHAVP